MTITELKALVSATGNHFFDRDTMRFFKSKVHNVYEGPKGLFFVTSEKPPHSGRRYTVRQWVPENEDVKTAGDEFIFKEDAMEKARALAGVDPASRALRRRTIKNALSRYTKDNPPPVVKRRRLIEID